MNISLSFILLLCRKPLLCFNLIYKLVDISSIFFSNLLYIHHGERRFWFNMELPKRSRFERKVGRFYETLLLKLCHHTIENFLWGTEYCYKCKIKYFELYVHVSPFYKFIHMIYVRKIPILTYKTQSLIIIISSNA